MTGVATHYLTATKANLGIVERKGTYNIGTFTFSNAEKWRGENAIANVYETGSKGDYSKQTQTS